MTTDPFVTAIKGPKAEPHKERAHSKFSASGAERWFNCPGSVTLSEGVPDKENEWSKAGTEAHELLEAYLKCELSNDATTDVRTAQSVAKRIPHRTVTTVANVSDELAKKWRSRPGSELLVETRVYLDFVHPEMFGTLDVAIIEHFGLLDVYDYKNGKSYVSPTENLQMLFYAVALAHKFDWNFKRVRLSIIQPNVQGYDGPAFWDLPIGNLKMYVEKFKRAVDRVEKFPEKYVEGSWCYWCKASKKCPLKTDRKNESAKNIFGRI